MAMGKPAWLPNGPGPAPTPTYHKSHGAAKYVGVEGKMEGGPGDTLCAQRDPLRPTGVLQLGVKL